MKRRSFFFQSNWKNNKTFLITPTLFIQAGQDNMLIVSFFSWSVGFRYVTKKVHDLRMKNMHKVMKKMKAKR